ncbi:glycine betaine ABC transporter substrate-binding protein [Niallia oryzisoli]|uniref:glycine betaine ABC transporter substrate-binding protein n=1 Tax=Niallia oryzisoli TaxID=1737571 RepID=UPI003736653F
MKKLIFGLIVLLISTVLAACGGSNETSGGTDTATSVGESVDYEIVGIDPGAGIMKAAAQAIDDYELQDWTLVEGSSAAMTAALTKAYEKKEPIIVTGWTPHWMYSKYDLKILDDPKGSFGEKENIHTIVRTGLQEDHTKAYQVLDQFHWTSDDMGEVMMQIQEGKNPEDAAEAWVKAHKEQVAEWTKGVEKADGEKLKLGYVAWDSEIASTHVIGKVLSDLGYDVTLSQVEAGPLWTGIADGSLDAQVSGWLPITHEDYVKKYKGQFEDLGTNLEGTTLGLTVPAYMEIDSIEDLK